MGNLSIYTFGEVLPKGNFSINSCKLSLLPHLLTIQPYSTSKTWNYQGWLAEFKTYIQLQSLGRFRL
jgi:hypothetical protein